MNFKVMYFVMEDIWAESKYLNKAPCNILSAKIEVYIKFYCEIWYNLPYISQMNFHLFCPFCISGH